MPSSTKDMYKICSVIINPWKAARLTGIDSNTFKMLDLAAFSYTCSWGDKGNKNMQPMITIQLSETRSLETKYATSKLLTEKLLVQY